MATLIKKRAITQDSWQLPEPASQAVSGSIPPAGDVLVPLATWQAAKSSLAQRKGRTGVVLEPHDDPAVLAADISAIPLIAVNFPKFSDGRGYSTGRLLRERYKFTGELRAIGDVLRDQLSLMERCGFDSFLLREDQQTDAALAAFGDFTETYQASVEQPVPLFRRRVPA